MPAHKGVCVRSTLVPYFAREECARMGTLRYHGLAMRIVAWNCAMALHKKAQVVAALHSFLTTASSPAVPIQSH